MRVLPGTLNHWQFVSNLKECKENCNLMMHQLFHGYMWKYQIASLISFFQVAAFLCSIYCGCLDKIALPFLILWLELPETDNFTCFEVLVVVLSVLSSGIWPCVDSYMGGFTWVYYFHLQYSRHRCIQEIWTVVILYILFYMWLHFVYFNLLLVDTLSCFLGVCSFLHCLAVNSF